MKYWSMFETEGHTHIYPKAFAVVASASAALRTITAEASIESRKMYTANTMVSNTGRVGVSVDESDVVQVPSTSIAIADAYSRGLVGG